MIVTSEGNQAKKGRAETDQGAGVLNTRKEVSHTTHKTPENQTHLPNPLLAAQLVKK